LTPPKPFDRMNKYDDPGFQWETRFLALRILR
jgi:hypothetical protein